MEFRTHSTVSGSTSEKVSGVADLGFRRRAGFGSESHSAADLVGLVVVVVVVVEVPLSQGRARGIVVDRAIPR